MNEMKPNCYPWHPFRSFRESEFCVRLTPRSLAASCLLVLFGSSCDPTLIDPDSELDLEAPVEATPQPISRSADPYLKSLPDDHAELIGQLGDPSTAEDAREKLAALGSAVLPSLQDAALLATDPVVQGWAITVIGSVEGDGADAVLQLISERTNTSELIRTWAAAARVQRADSLESLASLASLVASFPALARPVGLRASALVNPEAAAADLLTLAQSSPGLKEALGEAILAKGAAALLDVMLQGMEDPVRRSAAGYVGALGSRDSTLIATIVAGYSFDAGAQDVPWKGGALYVPSLSWERDDAQVLLQHLVAWHLYCDLKGMNGEQRQIYNNLRSVRLLRPLGLRRMPQDTHGMLHALVGVVGKSRVEAMLRAQGAGDNPRYDLNRPSDTSDNWPGRRGRRR